MIQRPSTSTAASNNETFGLLAERPSVQNDVFAVENGSSLSPIFDFRPDMQTSPSYSFGDFNAIAGEFGDFLPAESFPTLGLQASPVDSTQIGNLGFELHPQSHDGFDYFRSRVNPPFMLPWDESNWKAAKVLMVEMAHYCQPVRACILAVEQLYRQVEGNGEVAESLAAYFVAKSAVVLAMKNDPPTFDQLIVSTFLLCCVEVVAQQETISTTLKQRDSLITTIENHLHEKPWSPLAQRIIVWLYLLHAKAVHLGGRGILSPNMLSLLQDQLNPALCVPRPAGEALDNYDYLGQALQQVLFQFYFELQKISVQAASMNRHHRPRGVPADEDSVDSVTQLTERQLNHLWQGRPGVLDAVVDHSAPSKLAPTIYMLARLTKLCYFAEIIYYCRSQGRDTTGRIQSARAEIRQLIGGDCRTEVDRLLLQQPALVWPLFLYCVEAQTQDEVDWALSKFDGFLNPLWHTNFYKTFVRDLVGEQFQKANRVDSRLFCVERFGIIPPFI